MKGTLALLIVAVLIISGFGAFAYTDASEKNILSDTINFSNPQIKIKDDYSIIELPESNTKSMQTDNPMLPVVTKNYVFPFGTIIEKVNVVFSKKNSEHISKPVKPAPTPRVMPILNIKNEQVSNQVLTYSDIQTYPEKCFSYRTGAGIKNGEHVIFLSLSLSPVQYKPNENTITYSKNAEIQISYSLPKEPVVFPNEYDFLILAPQQFEIQLTPLINLKNEMGIKTNLVTLEEIPSLGGFDLQEDIKLFIKQSIEEWGVSYVLLVGCDVDGEELFPCRFVELGTFPYEDRFPSLLYYADIYDSAGGFSDWDADGDHRYAEYDEDFSEMDLFPDVYLGYLPCNNAVELITVVNKIKKYKEHNKMTNKILLLGGDTWVNDTEDIYEGEYLNEKVTNVLPGYSDIRLWGSKGTLTKAGISLGFMSWVDFVDFSGHGIYYDWGTHPPNDKSTWLPPGSPASPDSCFSNTDYDVLMINNGVKLPVIVYDACWTSKFTEDAQCMGWKPLSKVNGGGIATFSASAVSFTYSGTDASDGRWGWVEIDIFDELYHTKVLGEVWSNVITDYVNSFQSDFEKIDVITVASLAMFGDPTVVVQDGDDPRDRSFNFQLLDFIQKMPNIFLLINKLLKK